MTGNHLVASTAATNSFRTPREGCCCQWNSVGEKRCFRASSRPRSKDGKIGISHPPSIIFIQVQESWLSWCFKVVFLCSWLSAGAFLLLPLVFQCPYIVWENYFIMPVRLLANCWSWGLNSFHIFCTLIWWVLYFGSYKLNEFFRFYF